MRKLDILYKTSADCVNINYLYDKTDKVILPIETREQACSNIFKVFKIMLTCLKAELVKTEIYLYQDGVFYTYLNVQTKDGAKYKINCGVQDSLELATELNTPVYIKNSILDTQGIKITKELIRAQLEN